MGFHPRVLSRLFGNAVEGRMDAVQAAEKLGRFVVVGHLPDQVSADPAVVTHSKVVPNIRALHGVGVHLDMVCWSLGVQAGDIKVGRESSNDLVLPDVRVSHRHACLHVGDQVVLEDLASSSGTWVNGQQLASGEKRVLQENDTFSLGGFELRILPSVQLMEMLLNARPPVADPRQLQGTPGPTKQPHTMGQVSP